MAIDEMKKLLLASQHEQTTVKDDARPFFLLTLCFKKSFICLHTGHSSLAKTEFKILVSIILYPVIGSDDLGAFDMTGIIFFGESLTVSSVF